MFKRKILTLPESLSQHAARTGELVAPASAPTTDPAELARIEAARRCALAGDALQAELDREARTGYWPGHPEAPVAATEAGRITLHQLRTITCIAITLGWSVDELEAGAVRLAGCQLTRLARDEAGAFVVHLAELRAARKCAPEPVVVHPTRQLAREVLGDRAVAR
jgi:hypothetical protein